MTDAEYEAQKARVEALIERWVKPLGLGWWTIEFVYRRDNPPGASDGSNWDVLMSCDAKWHYLRAQIEIYLVNLVSLSDEALEKYFVHELMHVFLDELRIDGDDNHNDHEERVATTLANAFLWVRDALAPAASEA